MGWKKSWKSGASGAGAAPSVKLADWRGWLSASAILGSAAGSVALWAGWRPLLGLADPSASLASHAAGCAELAAHWLAPSLFKHGASAYSHSRGALSEGERIGLIVRGAIAAFAACAPAVLLAKPYLTPRDRLRPMRGGERLEGDEAVKRLRKRFAAQCRARPDYDIAPGVPYPADQWTRHCLMVGGSGAGKSTVLRPLITKIVEAGEQMICFDPKGEFTAAFESPAILAPWDERSLAWDIAADLRNLLDARRFAMSMIQDSADPMWSNAARQLLVGVIAHLQATRGEDWGWPDLAEAVALPQPELLALMRAHHPEAARAVERASVTTTGILINLASFCSPIFDLAAAWGETPKDRRVGFVDWAQGKARYPQIILQGHGAYADTTKSFAQGVLGVFSATINSIESEDDPDRKVWFIADEFGQAGKLPVRSLFEVGRSRGVRCVVACQDFAQLEEIYGDKMLRALVAMCGTLVVGNTMPGETADKLCKALGSREVERANISASTSARAGQPESQTLSFSRDDIDLYKPSELSSRLGKTPDGTGVTLCLFTHGDAHEIVWPIFPMRDVRPAHVCAQWLKPTRLAAERSGVATGSPAANALPRDATPRPSAGPMAAGPAKPPSVSGHFRPSPARPAQASLSDLLSDEH
ncbi:type IV secretion system DNA-binding domain-containing protein [Caballeronia sp. GAFFF2]|uniref:type IV secretion system DNA-binding domain-containing protein n=1 Tax=Caballeronia sp. GAFFF2 TaxID=2921741 RepID=UPI0020297F24|nr:type IV secretion system DNA-binding domain-containing protein [Caballeronia sp. GAFFF2]